MYDAIKGFIDAEEGAKSLKPLPRSQRDNDSVLVFYPLKGVYTNNAKDQSRLFDKSKFKIDWTQLENGLGGTICRL